MSVTLGVSLTAKGSVVLRRTSATTSAVRSQSCPNSHPADLDVGAGDVDLEAGDAGDALEAGGELAELADAVAHDVDEDGRVPARPGGGEVADQRAHARRSGSRSS